MFRCPVCKEPLAEDERTWRCDSGHSYDTAKEGYVNLLITHQRRQREPGDSADMLRARRAFLDGGHYAPLRDAVVGHIRANAAVLDVGCGEGYYTRDLDDEVWGIDIARDAVRLAARRGRSPRHHYAVASAYDLPVVDGSVDVALSVFSPLHTPELERVVRPGGTVLVAGPGPRHLDGLKALLFDEPELHDDADPFAGGATSLRLVDTTAVTYGLELEGAAIGDLLHMTPYAWYVSPERREAVTRRTQLAATADFRIFRYAAPSSGFPATERGDGPD
jgi:23S rRNA (guanine745-N1)-methyltransferase